MKDATVHSDVSLTRRQAISDTIRRRIQNAGASALANDNISSFVFPDELPDLEAEVAVQIDGLLRALVIDTSTDHNTRDTARRVAKMFVREVFSGRYAPEPPATAFPNIRNVDELNVIGPIDIRSTCAHHLAPIQGQAWIGVIATDRLIGLSKFHRIADWIMSRPQIQEEAADQLADHLMRVIGEPRALGIIIRAKHLCCGWRGVRNPDSLMTTSVMRGMFRDDDKARAEFLSLARGMGY